MGDYPQYMKDAYSAWARQLGVVQHLGTMNVPQDPIKAAEQTANYRLHCDVLNELHDAANAAYSKHQAEKANGGPDG